MKKDKVKELGIVEMKNFLSYDEKIEKKTNTFEKLMAIYDMAIAEVETKKVQIYQGNDRPIAVMIDNHNGAWPQAGLNQAYMVYEIIVEGGET